MDRSNDAGVRVDGGQRPEQAMDKREVLDRLDGDEGLLREVAVLFLEECPQRLADIRGALSVENGTMLAMAAHTLRGAVGLFSTGTVHEIAGALEQMGRDGDTAGADRAYAALAAEIERLKPSLYSLAESKDGT